MQDDDLTKKHESREENGLADFIQNLCTSEAELREIISYLIQNREALRDRELERLQTEADVFLNKLIENQQERLLECLACFKDILALHRQLSEQNDEQGDRGEDTEARSPRS